MRVLVTGGTGYLGRHVTAALARRGHEPIVFSRHASGAGLECTAIDGDVRDAAALARAARGCDALLHVAARVSVDGAPEEFDAVNVGGLRNALAAARASDTPRIVYTSSFLALPPKGAAAPLSLNDYQRTKVTAERIARAAAADGAPLVIVYPGVIVGPGVATEGDLAGGLLRDQQRGALPFIVGARRVWSFSFVEDVADGHALALERGTPGARYGLGGHNLPMVSMFEWRRRHEGRRVPIDLPMPLARFAAVLDETRARLTRRRPRLTRGSLAILSHDWPVDSSAAVHELGYRMTPFDEVMARTVGALEVAR